MDVQVCRQGRRGWNASVPVGLPQPSAFWDLRFTDGETEAPSDHVVCPWCFFTKTFLEDAERWIIPNIKN